MVNKKDKIKMLDKILDENDGCYADSFKTDLLFKLGDLNTKNKTLNFLDKLNSKNEIEEWVNKITSRIVMREDDDRVENIIEDYLENG
jgi:hypothetical protein